jgi:hypothetical protein
VGSGTRTDVLRIEDEFDYTPVSNKPIVIVVSCDGSERAAEVKKQNRCGEKVEGKKENDGMRMRRRMRACDVTRKNRPLSAGNEMTGLFFVLTLPRGAQSSPLLGADENETKLLRVV